MPGNEIRLSEVERKTDGIARSLDAAKGKIGALEKDFSRVEGIALSADRGFHSLAERIESTYSTITQVLKTQEAGRLETKEDLKYIRAAANKNMLWLMLYILTLLGLFFTAIKF